MLAPCWWCLTKGAVLPLVALGAGAGVATNAVLAHAVVLARVGGTSLATWGGTAQRLELGGSHPTLTEATRHGAKMFSTSPHNLQILDPQNRPLHSVF